jgi:dephospho-CoA kinase
MSKMSDDKRKPVLGLIGTIGAGKSAAANAFAARGGAVVDADRVGHEVLEEPAVREKLLARWGEKVLHPDGRINRRGVASIVFANEAERKALEAIVYPEIEARCRAAIEEAHANPAVKFVVLDAAVVHEAQWKGVTDKFVYIDAPRSMRLQRVLSRGWSDADLAAREAAQWPAAKKKALADATIENAGSLGELQTAVDNLLSRWGWL